LESITYRLSLESITIPRNIGGDDSPTFFQVSLCWYWKSIPAASTFGNTTKNEKTDTIAIMNTDFNTIFKNIWYLGNYFSD